MTKPGDTDDPELEALIKKFRAKSKKVRAELATTTGLQYRRVNGPHYVVALDGKIIGYVDWLAKRNGKVTQWQPKIALGMERLGACLTVRTAARQERLAGCRTVRFGPARGCCGGLGPCRS